MSIFPTFRYVSQQQTQVHSQYKANKTVKTFWLSRSLKLTSCALISLTLIACDTKPETSSEIGSEQKQILEINNVQAAHQLWLAQSQVTQASLESVHDLQTGILSLLDSPTTEQLTDTQSRWQKARTQMQALSFLFELANAEPIALKTLYELEYRLAAYPIQPGYLDRFGDYPISGLVFDIGFDLNQTSLIEQHGRTDSEEVVLGLYAIEFLLFSDKKNRSVNDFIPQGKLSEEHRTQGLQTIQEIPVNRRRTLLRLQAAQLVADCTQLHQISTLKKQGTHDAKNKHMQVSPLIQSWSALPASQQMQSVRHSINAVLTQTLVDMANLQTAIEKQANHDTPELTYTLENTVTALLNRLQSLSAGHAYLSSVEREAHAQAIKEISTLLNKSTGLTSIIELSPEKSKERLQKAYEKLRALI